MKPFLFRVTFYKVETMKSYRKDVCQFAPAGKSAMILGQDISRAAQIMERGERMTHNNIVRFGVQIYFRIPHPEFKGKWILLTIRKGLIRLVRILCEDDFKDKREERPAA